MTTLALDLGSHFGFAIEHADGRLESGHKQLPTGPRDGVRFQAFRNWLHETKRRIDAAGGDIDLVLFERVDFLVPGQVYAAHCWGGFWATLLAWCEHHRIAVEGVAVSTLKKLATGNGFSPKVHVGEHVRRELDRRKQPKAVTDDNEADALALVLFAAAKAREAA